MYALFPRILNMSLAAGVLVLAVLLLRLALRRAPKWLRCLLWALVAVRLLCPWSPQSSLSAFSLLPVQTTAQGDLEYFRYNGRTEKPLLEFELPRVVSPPDSGSVTTDAPTVTMHTSSRYLPPLETVWLAGMSVMLLYGVVSYLLLRRRVRLAVPLSGRLRLCEEIDSPFILGVFRPRIYLPAGLSDAAYQAVVAHETAHLARGDHFWKPLGFLLLTVHWFNPLLWLAWALLCRDIELACDERVVHDMEKPARADYSEALLACSTGRRLVRVCPLAFGEGGVKGRVKAVLNYKKPAFWLVLAAVLVCIAAGVFLLTNPMRKQAGDPSGRTPYQWTSTVTAAAVKTCELSGGYTLTEEEVALLVEKLNAVPEGAVRIGRGIPSNAVLDVTTGPGYRLRFAGGIIELDFDDQKAAAALYDPGVWEIHDEELYAFLEDLRVRTQHSVSEPARSALMEVLSSDGAQTDASLDRLLSCLMEYPKETLETMGAYPEGIRDWLCWSLAAHVQGMALDTGTPLSVENLNADGAAARDRIIGYFSDPGTAPKSWQQIYQEFEASGQMGDYTAAALIDFDFDGVPELAVWHGGRTGVYADSDISSQTYPILRDGEVTLYRTDGVRVGLLSEKSHLDAFLRAPQSGTQPLSAVRSFLLLRDRETGGSVWWVHSGVDKDGEISGSFEPLSTRAPVLPYQSYSERQDAAAQLLEKWEPVKLDYAAFTMLRMEITDGYAFLRLVNSWHCYSLMDDPEVPDAVTVTDPFSSQLGPHYSVSRPDLVEKLWDMFRGLKLSETSVEPDREALRAARLFWVSFRKGDLELARFSIWGNYLVEAVENEMQYYAIRDADFYENFLAVVQSAQPQG